LRRLLLRHWDLIACLLIAGECFQLSPSRLPLQFLKDIYSGGIAILAIVFSVVFAGISLLASAADASFIQFLEEEDGALTRLLSSFTGTLNVLFGSLIVSLILFAHTAFAVSIQRRDEPAWEFALFCFAVSYSLLSSRLIAQDVVRFATLRAKFIAHNSSE
jgi:hypothetical protein